MWRMDILRRVWSTWKRIGQAIGDLIARVVLSFFYFTFMLPFGLGIRLFGDPLQIKDRSRTLWLERAKQNPDLENARGLS